MMTASTTSSSVTSDPYISHSDQAELTRLQQLSGAQGLGDVLYDDTEMHEFLADLGIPNEDSARDT